MLAPIAAVLALAPAFVADWDASLTRDRKAALDRVSADSLRGHVAFLASDLLEGRGTPSRGLDIAAEYVAANFRRAGLEPGARGSYFQLGELTGRAAATADVPPVKNVVGVLRGSDPKLRDTYVIVSAHYDHLGVRGTGDGDRIYNGANDDASGTATLLEVAWALKNYRPKRTIVFVAFYGEELGLVGSRFYGRNPLFPVARTVAHVNLEQVGRTDDAEGPRENAISMTGQDYSDVGTVFAAAGRALGMRVERHPRYSDAFFARSDNQALADLGVPAHTVCTAFEFADYHRPGDHWDRLDYPNMARVNRLVALGVVALADGARAPEWNARNPRTEKYRRARAAAPVPGGAAGAPRN